MVQSSSETSKIKVVQKEKGGNRNPGLETPSVTTRPSIALRHILRYISQPSFFAQPLQQSCRDFPVRPQRWKRESKCDENHGTHYVVQTHEVNAAKKRVAVVVVSHRGGGSGIL